MRRYWQPVALAEELTADGAPRPVTIMGQRLVLFRNSDGQPGLLERACSHRGADLSYGRCEKAGLRCLYHGWLFDVDGRCLEQPGEPRGSTFHARISHPAFPCVEAGEIIFAYLGPGEPPPFPDFAWCRVAPDQRLVTKVHQACNYLQGNEGNLDQVHLGFLHQMNREGAPSRPFASTLDILAADIAPTIQTERTAFGLREYVRRKVGDGQEYMKMESFILPNAAAFPGAVAGKDGFQLHWHVPIDDRTHWKYVIVFQRTGVFDKAEIERTLFGVGELDEHYHLRRNSGNRFRQDRASMQSGDFAGFGPAFEVHDTWAVESAGPIQDRSREHLGYSDKSVIALRLAMRDAIATLESEGRVHPIAIGDEALDIIPVAEFIDSQESNHDVISRNIARWTQASEGLEEVEK